MTKQVDVNESLRSFFYQRVEQAMERRRAPLSRETQAYTVNFLASCARKTGLAGRTSRALALDFMEAIERGASALRDVGDRALYIAGVVPRSLDRSSVTVRYVTSIGSNAYRAVGGHLPNLTVFGELAEHFDTIRMVVGDAAAAEEQAHVNLLEVYERWLATRDARDAEILISAGMRLDAPESLDPH